MYRTASADSICRCRVSSSFRLGLPASAFPGQVEGGKERLDVRQRCANSKRNAACEQWWRSCNCMLPINHLALVGLQYFTCALYIAITMLQAKGLQAPLPKCSHLALH